MGGEEETKASTLRETTKLVDDVKTEIDTLGFTDFDFKLLDLSVRKDAPMINSEELSNRLITNSWDPKPSSLEPEDLLADTYTFPSVDLSIDQARVSVSFLVKKSKSFCGAIRFNLRQTASTNISKLRRFVSSLTDSVKSTLAKAVPSSKSISHITSSLVNSLKGKRLPSSLRLLGLRLTSYKKRNKKIKDNETFLCPDKKPELESMAGFQFVKPKFYECGHCGTRFFKLPIYIKHIRRHNEIISCESCGKTFACLKNKKKHEVQCVKRAIL